MTVTIPDSYHDFVSSQIASGQYSDESALICALLNKEQLRNQRESIDRKLLEGLDSSEAVEMTSTDWADIRAEVQRRHILRNNGRP